MLFDAELGSEGQAPIRLAVPGAYGELLLFAGTGDTGKVLLGRSCQGPAVPARAGRIGSRMLTNLEKCQTSFNKIGLRHGGRVAAGIVDIALE